MMLLVRLRLRMPTVFAPTPKKPAPAWSWRKTGASRATGASTCCWLGNPR